MNQTNFIHYPSLINLSTAPLLGIGSTQVDLHGMISFLLTVVTTSLTVTGNIKKAQPSVSSALS